MSTERVIVIKDVAEQLISALKRLIPEVTAGDPSGTKISSLFTETSAKNVVSLLEDAKNAGAEVLHGDLKRDGALVSPHIVVGVKRGMRLWEQESFGPSM
jgi:acyl-CoA reductase-like NAD-dependent aldehyde dehydrogenase